MVEVDVRFTSDGTAVVIHDDSLDRTTNGSGAVAAQRYNDLKNLTLMHPATGQPFNSNLAHIGGSVLGARFRYDD